MLLPFGACIAVEFVLFVFANDSGQNNNEISAILQKLKTLEEEVSTLKQGLKSCQSGRNEFSKSNTEISEYKLWSLSKPATCFVGMFRWWVTGCHSSRTYLYPTSLKRITSRSYMYFHTIFLTARNFFFYIESVYIRQHPPFAPPPKKITHLWTYMLYNKI